MKVYYALTKRKKAVFYIPKVVIGIQENMNFNFDLDPNTLQGIYILLRKRFIDLEALADRGWEFYEMDIPITFVKELEELCFDRAPDSYIQEKLYEILDYTDIKDY